MFSFTTNPTITITDDNQDARAKKNFKLSDKETVEIPIYTGQENISGVVDVQVPAGKKIEHQGIRIEMIGQTGKSFPSAAYHSHLGLKNMYLIFDHRTLLRQRK